MHITLATAPNPGAVAIIQLQGEGVGQIIAALTAVGDWPLGRWRYVKLADIDEGCVVCLRYDWAQVMPHGGQRVVAKLIDWLVGHGGQFGQCPSPCTIYPEAATDLEADMLGTIASAASPLAIDLLLDQPRLWHDALDQAMDRQTILRSSERLDRLIDPPTVVVIGRANVGKSTLTNSLLGKSVSIVADLPGTTRDWVCGLVEINQIAVNWLDTPGLRQSDDVVEQCALELARRVVKDADVLIAMRDPDIDWPDENEMPRRPDLWVINKIDEPAQACSHPTSALKISALNGVGLDVLEQSIIEKLHLTHLTPGRAPDTLWAFSPVLRTLVQRDNHDALRRYVTATV